MADDRPDLKRKYDDTPVAAIPRRPSGFSTSIAASPSPDGKVPPPSYNSVPPPVDDIQLAKQKAQEIAARLFSDAEAKRPRVENGGGADDASDRGYGSAATDHSYKPLGQQISNPQLGTVPPAAYPSYGYHSASKKIEIPNGRVGVIIGKGGETIKYLQLQSGAKIQVTRDMDADPNSQTRLVELMGTSEQISKAEQLITDVLQQAEIGGSGIVAARNYVSNQPGTEHFTMKIPNNKVGLIIGKGGETIKSMQATTGAHIQVVPLHLPPGDPSTERTLHIDGTQEQIDSAKQLVDEIISETRVRNPSMSGGYSQQGYRPPRPQTSWAPPGGPPQMQQPGYGYMQPGSYPGAPPQYNMSQPPYAGYPSQPASAGYTGWDQSGNQQGQQGASGSGYDYYNQGQQSQLQPGSSAVADNTTYNYGQPPTSNYDSTYSQQPAGQQQGYGQDAYSGGGYGAPQPQSGYTQPPSTGQPGYDQSQSYGSAQYGTGASATQDASTYASHGGPSQVPSSQPPASQQGYSAQQPGAAPPTYPSQGAQPGYGMPSTSQPGYGGQQNPVSTVYGQPAPLSQPGYGLPSPGSKPPPSPAGYGQPATYGGAQPPPVPSAYAGGHASGYASGAPQPGYGQQQPYNSTPAPGAGGYSQQPPQSYGESYGAGGYSQTPVYSDNAAGGTPAASAIQTAPSGVKASPQAQS